MRLIQKFIFLRNIKLVYSAMSINITKLTVQEYSDLFLIKEENKRYLKFGTVNLTRQLNYWDIKDSKIFKNIDREWIHDEDESSSNTDMLKTHQVRLDNINRYEVTITFDPKLYYGPEDCENYINNVWENLTVKVYGQLQLDERAYIAFTKEYQANGMPHVHATVVMFHRLKPMTQHNWEQFFRRNYGKTTIYYTGKNDKWHKNDHFEGPWSEYLKKDGIEHYSEICLKKILFKKTNN